MYILVQGAVPKSNSAHCLLLYISCLIPLVILPIFQDILFLPNISIVDVNVLVLFKMSIPFYLNNILIILCSLYCEKNNYILISHENDDAMYTLYYYCSC